MRLASKQVAGNSHHQDTPEISLASTRRILGVCTKCWILIPDCQRCKLAHPSGSQHHLPQRRTASDVQNVPQLQEDDENQEVTRANHFMFNLSNTVLPAIEEILETNIPTLHHVPYRARSAWSAALESAINYCDTKKDDLTGLQLLYMLPKCVLAVPPRRGKSHRKRLQNTVLWRLDQLGDSLGKCYPTRSNYFSIQTAET